MSTIYFDNNATTPLAPEVLQAMLPYYQTHYGNPSSSHAFGLTAERVLKSARAVMANLWQVEESEIIFTSGGTESINLAIKGMAQALQRHGRHIVAAPTEHRAVLNSLQQLTQAGFTVSFVKTTAYAAVTPEAVLDAMQPDTILVIVMHVNNELGTINPIVSIAESVKRKNKNTRVFCDGVQGFGKLAVPLLPIDAYAMSSHKLHGPKGVGALFLKKGTPCKSLLSGGEQENGYRAGTENVPGIIGLVKAAEMAYKHLTERKAHITTLKKRLLEGLLNARVLINSPVEGLFTTLNVSFMGIPAEIMLNKLSEKGICVSAGSACHHRNRSGSHVLKAIGYPQERANSAIRFSLSYQNTVAEVEKALDIIHAILKSYAESSTH